MRELPVSEIQNAVERLCIEANYFLPEEITNLLKQGYQKEVSETGKDILLQILQNEEICRAEQVPLCQDTGTTCVFVFLGQEVHLTGGTLREAVDEGVRRGYKKGYLRQSIVRDPLLRENTRDNTPAMLHVELEPGEECRITVMPKGGGCENMSALKMLRPSDGKQGIINFVADRVYNAGGNPCPPLVLGVGIGGNFDTVAYLAKKALLRGVGKRNPQQHLAQLEAEIKQKCNETGVGPMGLGGVITVLEVNIEAYPTHIASLPVAMCVNCHSSRYKSAVIG